MTDPTGPDPTDPTPDVLVGDSGVRAPESPTRTINRRAAIGIIGGAAAAAALGLAYVAKERADDEPAPPPVAADTSSTGGIPAIGEAYLAATPDEQSQPELLAALGLPDEVADDPEAQLSVLAEQIHTDFAAATVVQLDGWALSVTEARLAALIALQARPSGS
jgi:hypothetical protein